MILYPSHGNSYDLFVIIQQVIWNAITCVDCIQLWSNRHTSNFIIIQRNTSNRLRSTTPRQHSIERNASHTTEAAII